MRVAIVDRGGIVLGVETVIRIDRRFIETSSKRWWTHDGLWMDETGRAYPFPTIAHATEDGYGLVTPFQPHENCNCLMCIAERG